MVNGSLELLEAPPEPPGFRDWRKFWTRAEASVDPAVALGRVSTVAC